MDITRGVFPALVTPFQEDGEINYDALGDLIEDLEESGIDGVVPCGSTGESATLTHNEHMEIVDYVVDKASTPVIAGTGSNSTREALELTGHADDAGADAALLISPYYNLPNRSGLVEHYTDIADSVDIPLILYNVPGRTGQNLGPEWIKEMASHPNIAAVKEASGDINQVSRITSLTSEEDFDVISGDDSMTLPILSVGGVGVISVAANVFPERMSELVHSYLEGDTQRARNVHLELMELFDVMFIESNPIPVKVALEELGVCSSRLRSPLNNDIPGESRDEINRVLSGL